MHFHSLTSESSEEGGEEHIGKVGGESIEADEIMAEGW